MMLILSLFLQLSYANELKALPKGRDYLFCGDRIFYSSNFDNEIKLDYPSGTRLSSFKNHCSYRIRNIEKQIKKSSSNEPLLLVGNYKRLKYSLDKVVRTKKHKIYVKEKGYHYKEIFKAFGKQDLEKLMQSNLLLPYLSKAEFAQIYEGSTNNPKFLKTEYERYSANLLSQHPALLYTKDGKLFYFSYRLNQDVLDKISSGLTKSAMSGNLGNIGGSSPSSSGGIAKVNKKSIADKIDKKNDNKGIEAFFPSFISEIPDLKIAPQSITMPSTYNRSSSSAVDIPSYEEIVSSVKSNKTKNKASTPKRRVASKFSAKTSSASNYLRRPMPIPIRQIGMKDSKRDYSFIRSDNNNKSNMKNKIGGKTLLNKHDQDIERFEKDPSKEKVVAGADVEITFPQLELDDKNSKYVCKNSIWPHTLQHYYLKSQCLPKEKKDCLESAKKRITNICNKFFDTVDDEKQLLSCSENLQLLTCGKIPCDLELAKDGLKYQLQIPKEAPIHSLFEKEEADLPGLSYTIDIAKTIVSDKREQLINYLSSNTNNKKWPLINKTKFLNEIEVLATTYNYLNTTEPTCKTNNINANQGEN